MSTSARIRIGDVPIDSVDLRGALDAIDALVARKEGGTVFTPNVDHVVVARQNARFREAYAAVSLSLADGMPLLVASRLLKSPLPGKVSGSDLIVPLMQRAAERGYRVFFLGGDPGAAERAREVLQRDLPALKVVGVDDSRIDVDRVSEQLIERIRATQPDLVVVALGAPKQELFSHSQREALKPAVLVGLGASLDFVAQIRRRAPVWISRVGLEWFFRFLHEPRRLAHRYFVRDPYFLVIVAEQLRQGTATWP